MGYIPCFCIACGSPVGFGFGLPCVFDPDMEWHLQPEEVSWCTDIKLLTEKGLVGSTTYDEFGVNYMHSEPRLGYSQSDAFVYTGFSWPNTYKCQHAKDEPGWRKDCACSPEEIYGAKCVPSIVLHSDCLEYMCRSNDFHGLKKDDGEISDEKAGKVAGKLLSHMSGYCIERGVVKLCNEGVDMTYFNGLLPDPSGTASTGEVYGDVKSNLDQFFEFEGTEWSLRSPLVEVPEAERNRNRIDGVLAHIASLVGPL